MNTLELKSPHDGSVLVFEVTRRSKEDTEFEVSVRTPYFTGRARSCTFFNGPPTDLFSAMALEWQGWTGEKHWQDIERQVSLTATTDSTGHVSLLVEMRGGGDADSLLRTVVQFEAGQLEEMAKSVAELLPVSQVST